MVDFGDFDGHSAADSEEFDDFDGRSALGSEEFESETAGRTSRPVVVHTAHISLQPDKVQICVTSLSGESKGTVALASEATIRQLEVDVKDMYQWTSVSFFHDDGTEADRADHLKDHTRLTMKARTSRFPRRALDAARQCHSTLPEVRGMELMLRDHWDDHYDSDSGWDGDSCDDDLSAGEDRFLTFSKYAKDSRRSQFVNLSTGTEVSPDDISLNGVKSLAIRPAGTHLLQDFAHIEESFPHLECFEYFVEDGYGMTYDLRGLANPLWSSSLKTLRLHLGACHICEGTYGLEVLGSLSNLEVFDVSHFRHAALKDLKVVEHFAALVELSFRGAIDDHGDCGGVGDGEMGVALNLSKHVRLRKVEFEDYCSSLSFCTPGERRGRGIQLHLPFLGPPCGTSIGAGSTENISVRLLHHGYSMFTRRLRNAIVQSGAYTLEERLSSSLEREAEFASSAQMNELWCKDFLEGIKFEQDSLHSRVQHEVKARAGITEIFVDDESVLSPSLFPPTKLFGLGSTSDLQRWVGYSDLPPRPVHYEVGDHCFLLALVSQDGHCMTDHFTFRSGSGCCSASNVGASILRNSRGLFMVECEVRKRSVAANAKLVELKREMAAEGFGYEHEAAQRKEEYEYSVDLCSRAADPKLGALVHESFLFSEIPSGWTSRAELSIGTPFMGAAPVVFSASLPPDRIVKAHRGPSCGHPVWHDSGGRRPHKRQRAEGSRP
mmetsp:Transcript_6170/g.16450  ORF Transcript_6170/g.16450 Transcript_6170/m.16450 type:complete len:721 (-) Transcript_6170:100-2262(-)|eukprot:CAMPEP_0171182618 /NCGR_PEP_ID=MMETSP0790-20130122/14860_1 /TAXON_ID=2925 /ORGANISM="Alexandrium catenella, Strain OF101" /LENGTH=720 /DNA_ID=CAMNT_0011647577 /DNA_START=74 /DNA_END=2236 /DNA_ORIENTATION=+